MTLTRRTDWTSIKRSQIVMLRENGLSYAEIARQVCGSVTCSGVRKFCLHYEKTKSEENKAKSGQKKCTRAIENLNGYAFKIEKFHQMPLDVK